MFEKVKQLIWGFSQTVHLLFKKYLKYDKLFYVTILTKLVKIPKISNYIVMYFFCIL